MAAASRVAMHTSRARPSVGSVTRWTKPARSRCSTRKAAVCLLTRACSASSLMRVPFGPTRWDTRACTGVISSKPAAASVLDTALVARPDG